MAYSQNHRLLNESWWSMDVSFVAATTKNNVCNSNKKNELKEFNIIVFKKKNGCRKLMTSMHVVMYLWDGYLEVQYQF